MNKGPSLVSRLLYKTFNIKALNDKQIRILF
jgi:hypothetical protein